MITISLHPQTLAYDERPYAALVCRLMVSTHVICVNYMDYRCSDDVLTKCLTTLFYENGTPCRIQITRKNSYSDTKVRSITDGQKRHFPVLSYA